MPKPIRTLVREAEDLDQLVDVAQDLFISRRRPIETRNDLRTLLQRAYSLGYDAAHQDHVDGNIG